MEGGDLPALQVAVDQICALLALRGAGEGESRVAIEKHLAALKVNTRLTSLGRFRGTVAYVLGDAVEGAPQLWIFKDHFNPARVRFVDDKQAAWDVHFFDSGDVLECAPECGGRARAYALVLLMEC